MNYQDEHIEQIIARYLSGRMTANEEADFLRFVAESPNLTKRIENERFLRQALIEDEILLLRSHISKDLKQQKQNIKFWKFLSIGCGLLIVSGILVWSLTDTNDVKSLTQKFQKQNQIPSNPSIVLAEKAIENQVKGNTKENDLNAKTFPKNDSPEGYNVTKSPEDLPVATSISTDHKMDKEEVREPILTKSSEVKKNGESVNCAGFDPQFTISKKPSFRNAADGSVVFQSKTEKLVFWLSTDSIQKGKQFQQLNHGKYAYFVQNEVGCIWGPKELVIENTYCLEDSYPKHYKSLGNFKPDVHDDVLSVVLYDKQGRKVEELQKTNLFEWEIQPGTPTGLYVVEANYPNGEKCRITVTLFE